MSAGAASQKSEQPGSSETDQYHLQAGIQNIQGHLFVLDSYLAVPGAQQGLGHSNTAITELIQ